MKNAWALVVVLLVAEWATGGDGTLPFSMQGTTNLNESLSYSLDPNSGSLQPGGSSACPAGYRFYAAAGSVQLDGRDYQMRGVCQRGGGQNYSLIAGSGNLEIKLQGTLQPSLPKEFGGTLSGDGISNRTYKLFE